MLCIISVVEPLREPRFLIEYNHHIILVLPEADAGFECRHYDRYSMHSLWTEKS